MSLKKLSKLKNTAASFYVSIYQNNLYLATKIRCQISIYFM